MNSSLIHPNKSTSGELNRPRSACGPLTMNSSLMATISTSQIPMDLVLQAQPQIVSELSPSSSLITPTKHLHQQIIAWRSLGLAQRSSRKPPGATLRIARRNTLGFASAPKNAWRQACIARRQPTGPGPVHNFSFPAWRSQPVRQAKAHWT